MQKKARIFIFGTLFLAVAITISAAPVGAECSPSATVDSLPVDGLVVDVCINGELHIVTSSQAFLVKGEGIPPAFAEEMASEAAELNARRHLEEFVQSARFKSSRLYDKSLSQVFGKTTKEVEGSKEGEAKEKEVKEKKGSGITQESSLSYELQGRALAGAFTLRNKKDRDFVSVTLAVSESSMRTASFFGRLNDHIISGNPIAEKTVGSAPTSGSKGGVSSYSGETPNRDWVAPPLRTKQ